MKIILSPAKKMVVDTDALPWQGLPAFLPQARELLGRLRELSYEELKTLWRCSDAIARPQYEALQTMDLERRLTPALLSYEGIQYQYMAPRVFTYGELDYVQAHVGILSGFYGLLRPMDGVTPYRLEMQARLRVGEHPNLYAFWGGRLADCLAAEGEGCILNLASREYSRAVAGYLSPEVALITCVFGQLRQGKVVEKGTLCKMARGEMVRFLAEKQVQAPEGARDFARLGYRFAPERSNDCTYVFLQEETP